MPSSLRSGEENEGSKFILGRDKPEICLLDHGMQYRAEYRYPDQTPSFTRGRSARACDIAS